MLTAAGCSASGTKQPANKSGSPQTYDDVLASVQAPTFASNANESENDYFSQGSQASSGELTFPKLDYDAEIDVTGMDANMIYAQINDMVVNAGKYKGKTVKIEGTFDVFTDVNTGKYYYTCMIADAAACCKRGIEFEPAEELSYPDGFPKVAAPVTVGGEFSSYEEDGTTYYTLKNAEFAY